MMTYQELLEKRASNLERRKKKKELVHLYTARTDQSKQDKGKK